MVRLAGESTPGKPLGRAFGEVELAGWDGHVGDAAASRPLLAIGAVADTRQGRLDYRVLVPTLCEVV